jgi:hypothetical protein
MEIRKNILQKVISRIIRQLLQLKKLPNISSDIQQCHQVLNTFVTDGIIWWNETVSTIPESINGWVKDVGWSFDDNFIMVSHCEITTRQKHNSPHEKGRYHHRWINWSYFFRLRYFTYFFGCQIQKSSIK